MKIIGELDGKPVPSRASPALLLKVLAAAGETASLFTPVPLETMVAACYKWLKAESRLSAWRSTRLAHRL